MKKRIALLSVFLCIIITASAQNKFGVLPQINTKIKISDGWAASSKLEAKQIFFQNPYPDGESEIEFERIDFESVFTRTKGPLSGFGVGYLLRYNGDYFIHRFIQQYAFSKKLTNLQISHRIRTDQTLEEDKATRYRLRYRIGLKKPIGNSNDFFLEFNNEYLGTLQSKKGNLEIRAAAAVGYNISEKDQFEVGLDYRAEQLITKTEHELWLSIGWSHDF
ncbi:DUF2490 domain-containing protein [Albibacterium bauzanense]|uniref:Uncharacterized protein DUF2490 n=1 Tax=Albibacterium bauzanense TaxID=653929 RepID=A0A4R1LMT3_9SPHI|nr:DUF2490 domain-containing protein [Albibacterium bauzanense]TCK79544.1 uncharacterized protein DUF2490 [Albibacterium bauzanense]